MDWFAEPVFGCVLVTDPANHGLQFKKNPGSPVPEFTVNEQPGSTFVLTGASRYNWLHGVDIVPASCTHTGTHTHTVHRALLHPGHVGFAQALPAKHAQAWPRCTSQALSWRTDPLRLRLATHPAWSCASRQQGAWRLYQLRDAPRAVPTQADRISVTWRWFNADERYAKGAVWDWPWRMWPPEGFDGAGVHNTRAPPPTAVAAGAASPSSGEGGSGSCKGVEHDADGNLLCTAALWGEACRYFKRSGGSCKFSHAVPAALAVKYTARRAEQRAWERARRAEARAEAKRVVPPTPQPASVEAARKELVVTCEGESRFTIH